MTDDEQEAGSIKYNTARIVKLTSGNFALFAPWSNREGMLLITIGTLDQLESLIPSTDDILDWCNEREDPAEYDEVKAKSLLEALGLSKPKPKLERRL